MGPFLLAVALVVYNSVVNLWGPFHRWAYVPLNLVIAGTVIGLGLGPLNLSASEIGFGGGFGIDAATGAGLGLALALPVLGAAWHPRSRRFVADRRVRSRGAKDLAYQMIIRIPAGTAFLEEVAFRGVLYAAWRPGGIAAATLFSALAFGFWHVTPTWNLIRANRLGTSPARAFAEIGAAVALTAVAGVGFAALREARGGLGTPLALHAVINSVATAAAVLAHRRAEKPT